MSRPTPFDLALSPIAESGFPEIRAAIQRAGNDPRDRDRFLLLREVVTLLRELRPEEGLGEGIDQLAAFLHHGYLYWDAGRPVFDLGAERAAALLLPTDPDAAASTAAAAAAAAAVEPPAAYYARFPERRVWAAAIPREPAEPMDGCFVHGLPDDAGIRVLGIFGVRPERMGFSVVEAGGPRPTGLVRPDGTPLFAPTLPGGAAARLHSLAGAEELVELGWRTRAIAGESVAEGATAEADRCTA